MADNIQLSANIGTGSVIATEDEGGFHYQKVKLTASGTGTTADLSRAEDTAHTTGDHGIMALSVRSNTAASTSGADGDYQPLITDTNGRLHTNDVSTAAALSGSEFQVDVVAALPAGTNTIGKLAANAGVVIGDVNLGATDNAVLDNIAAQSTTTAAGYAAEAAALGSGVLIQGDDGTDRKNINVDATTGDIQVDITHTVTVDGSGVTQPVSGTVTANLSATDNAVLDQIEINTSYGDSVGAGTEAAALRVTLATDSTGLLSIDDNGGSLTVDGTVTANLSAVDNAVLDDIAAKLAPNTTNGHTPYLNQDTSAIASVKGSAGTIYWISCMSIDATPVYLNLYDSTTAILGTTTPTNQFIIPTQGDANGSGFTINFGQLGIQYSTGIQVAAATTFNGSTDPGTNIVITNIGYE